MDKNNSKQTISVCIATFNGSHYLKPQLDSILSQLSIDDEIIISDDGSSDDTLEIISSYHDKRIKVFSNTGEHGYTRNFENALKHAINDIIFLADQDDIWERNKVSRCVEALRNYDMVVHDAYIINADGVIIANSYYSERNVFFSLIGNIVKFGYLGCCLAFKRTILTKALPLPKNQKLASHDNWLFLIGQTFFKTYILKDKLIRYRRHGNNASSGGAKSNTSVSFKIKYRIYLMGNLIKRTLIRNDNKI